MFTDIVNFCIRFPWPALWLLDADALITVHFGSRRVKTSQTRLREWQKIGNSLGVRNPVSDKAPFIRPHPVQWGDNFRFARDPGATAKL